MGWYAHKRGGKNMGSLLLILGGIFYILYGASHSIILYAVTFTIVVVSLNGHTWVSCASMTSQWFPRKKGIVMGITTLGNNTATILFVPMIAFFMNRFGITSGIAIFGSLMIVIGLAAAFSLKNTPEEAGCFPDNITPEQEKEFDIPPIASLKEDTGYVSQWTLGKILSTKEFWLVSIALALCFLGTIAGIVQNVIRIQEFGFSENNAILFNSLFAGIACFGSYFWGWVDQKWDTKKAIFWFSIFYASGFFINTLAYKAGISVPILFVSMFILSWCLGGTANFSISMTSSLWGRKDFMKAFTPLNIIITGGRMTGFAFIAFFSSFTPGTLQGSYIAGGFLFVIAAILISLVNVKKFIEKHPLNQ
jgi:sugar phosphate permease